MSQIITLAAGQIELLDPPLNLLRRLRSALPFGLMRFNEAPMKAQAGIVMKCGDQEVFGVKFQPPDCPQDAAMQMFKINRMRIVLALAGLVGDRFDGVFIPVAYMRQKESAFESGVACFAFPAGGDKVRADFAANAAMEEHLMSGAFMYVLAFAKHLQAATVALGLPQQRIVGMDTRPRLQLGSIMFDIMMCGKELLSLKCDVNAQDPLWAVLHRLGVRRIWHIPTVPVDIPPEELPRAQGKLPVN